jgi:hypothetical protein
LLKRLAIFLIKLYKRLRPVQYSGKCIFRPTCSRYALEAISLHGFFRGIKLTYFRIKRCKGENESQYDPVPTEYCACKNLN